MALDTTLHKRLKQATVEVVQALALESDDPEFYIRDKVYDQLLPDETNIAFPCVIVTTEGERDKPIDGTTEHYYHEWPVRVFLADRTGSRQHEKEGTYLLWRKAIYDAFHQKRPLVTAQAASEFFWCNVEPQVVWDSRLPQYQHIVSGMVLRYWTRELRS